MSKGLRHFLIYSAAVLALSIGYYAYALLAHSPSGHNDTFFTEVGEAIGEIALWAFVLIYARTAIKLVMGKGPMARRLLPDYTAPDMAGLLKHLVVYLDRTHIYLGVATVALVLIHIGFMGLHSHILFFPIVLALVIWQAVFGMFLAWRRTPRDLKRWSYGVHAQLITGVAIGVLAYFGHLLIDD